MDDLLKRMKDSADAWAFEAKNNGRSSGVENILYEAIEEMKRLRMANSNPPDPSRSRRWDQAISELEARVLQEMNALRPSHETSYSRLADLTTALMNLHIIQHNTRNDE